ncbi:MAG: conjugal transfer protein TraH [Candidatus Omnitrophica bacterium]|nr:conjugal transfer protein TraH [Candidatus Omnitrophota bacterium]
MKYLVGAIISLFVAEILSYGDVFDPPSYNARMREISDNDTSGYIYRGGVGYVPYDGPKRDPQINMNQSISLGCSGFDFENSFKSVFNKDALSDMLASQGKEIIAAAPMLLLEYASPTLADLLKHFNNQTLLKLNMDYMRCADIESAVSGGITKMRKQSEMECIDEKARAGVDISTAMKYCKDQSDPFAFLKDINDQPLYKGGSINVLSDSMKKLNVLEKDAGVVNKLVGETTITKDGRADKEPEYMPKDIYHEYYEYYYGLVNDVIEEYERNGKVTDAELDSISIPGVPITTTHIRYIVSFGNKKEVEIHRLATVLALWKTYSSYSSALEVLDRLKSLPDNNEEITGILENKSDALKYNIARFKQEYEEMKSYYDQINVLTNEAVEENIKTLSYYNGIKRKLARQSREEDSRLLGI